ncbi:hypothetical protein L7F22_038727 [Adiantum nelumboides]|nr:hypothetical protein [Adiantum nelumboides]
MAVGLKKEKIQSVKDFLVDMNDMLKAAHERICSARDCAQTYANKACRKVTFEKGDFMFLKVPAKLETMKTGKCDKLSARYCGHFKILKKIGDVAYKLELPESSQVHPVFHVNKLKKSVHGLENIVSPNILVDLIEPPRTPHESERILGSHFQSKRYNLRRGDVGVGDQQRLDLQVKCLAEEVQSLRDQVTSLELEINKQRRLKVAFKTHAGNLGDYLKACLQELEARGIQEQTLRETLAKHHRDGNLTGQQLLVLKEKGYQNGWYISPTAIDLSTEIVGSGSTSDTYKGIWRGLEVAVKCIRPSLFNDERSVQSFCQEVDLLSRVRHPNVVQFLGASLSIPDKAWIVMECMSLGTLTEWLHGSKKRTSIRIMPLPPFRERLNVALGIAQGMQYLHDCDPRILHRDLKPSNVFMDRKGGIRISDFGYAKVLSHDTTAALTGETGTYIYMAPEVVRHEPYDDKCDVYSHVHDSSFGVLLCELLTGVPPYIDMDLTPVEIAFSVAQGTLRPNLPKELGPVRLRHKALPELVGCMWDHDPSKRPPFTRITQVLKDVIKSYTGPNNACNVISPPMEPLCVGAFCHI